MPRALIPYNPLDKQNLGISVADALLAQSAESLSTIEPFIGAGIYALYYTGDYSVYGVIAESNRSGQFSQPIYVGKAVPRGASVSGVGLGTTAGTVLFDRLKEHYESIEQVQNLVLRDFYCRYLAVDDIWIPLAEHMLIERFRPIWNTLVKGFGIHDPGSGRGNQRRSLWDTLHPGRPFAASRPPNTRSEQQIIEIIVTSLPTGSFEQTDSITSDS